MTWRAVFVVASFALGSGCTVAPSQPTRFECGQVWRDAAETPQDSVQFLVVGTGFVPEFGDVVAVRLERIGQLMQIARAATSGFAQLSDVQVYPEPLLRRYTGQHVTSVSSEFFGEWHATEWLDKSRRSGVRIQTLRPSVVVRKLTALAAEFKILESKLPAYLPKEQEEESERPRSHEIPTLDVAIVAQKIGDERKVTYRADGKRLEDLHAVAAAVKAWVVRQPPRFLVQVVPGEKVLYGDVAPLVDTLARLGIKDIRFGGGLAGGSPASPRTEPKPEPRLAAGQVWRYRDAAGATKTVTIRAMTELAGVGEIAFVRFDGVPPVEGEFAIATDWVPYWSRSIRSHVVDLLRTDTPPADDAPVRAWHAAFAKGERGFGSQIPEQFVALVEARRRMTSQKDLEDLILPRAEKKK